MPQVDAQLSEELSRLLSDPSIRSAFDAHAWTLSDRYEALPAMQDWCLFLIRPSGEVVEEQLDGDPIIVHNELLFLAMVRAASSKYPSLSAFVPVRPMQAPDCTECQGTGRYTFGGRCPFCVGFGWLPLAG